MKQELVKSSQQPYVRQVWLACLGLLGKVQKESARLFETLVKEGEKAEARPQEATQTLIPTSFNALRDQAMESVHTLKQWFQEGVARALNLLWLPNKEDMQALSSRVDELQSSIQELVAVKKPEPRVRETAVKEVEKVA